jgi:DNA mismatch repair protein MutH
MWHSRRVEPIRPPKTEEELLQRARSLAGRTVEQLAVRVGQVAPPDQRRNKGFVGQLLEANLGATAANRSAPDFERLGIEMKSLPIGPKRVPTETTYICVAPMTNLAGLTWRTSRVWHKMARILWVPIQADKKIPLPQRRVGMPMLWSPNPEEEALLQADWTELTDLIRLGEADEITARIGTALHIRPKAADSKVRTRGIDASGHHAETLPLGFYLRPSFTCALLQRHFHGG